MKGVRLSRQIITSFVMSIVFACGPGGSPKLPPTGFKVEFGKHNIPAEMVVGQRLLADVSLKNVSASTWPSTPDPKGLNAVNLSYHWFNQKKRVIVFDGLRTPLPHDLSPGESVRLNAAVQAPDQPGRYMLEVTLVQEGVAWFPERGGEKLVLPISVVAGKAEASAATGKEPLLAVGTPKVASRTDPRPEKAVKSPLDNGNAEKLRLQRSQNNPVTAQVDKATKEQDQRSHPWSVQVGSYPQENDAKNVAKRLSDKGYDAYVVTGQVKGKSWHRVQIGRFPTKTEAEKLWQAVKTAEGLKQSFITNLR